MDAASRQRHLDALLASAPPRFAHSALCKVLVDRVSDRGRDLEVAVRQFDGLLASTDRMIAAARAYREAVQSFDQAAKPARVTTRWAAPVNAGATISASDGPR